MTHGIDLEIRTRLGQYLGGEISLHEFEDWFIPTAWGILRTANGGLAELVGEIELRLAEFSNGHWTEPELRAKLEPLVSIYETAVASDYQESRNTYSLESSLSLRVTHLP